MARPIPRNTSAARIMARPIPRNTNAASQPHNGWVWAMLVLVPLVFVPVLWRVAHTPKPVFVSKPAFSVTAAKPSDSSSSIGVETNSVSRTAIVRDTDSSLNDSSGTTSSLRFADTQQTTKRHASVPSTSGTPSRKMLAGTPHDSSKHERSDVPEPTPYRGPMRSGQSARIRAYSDEIQSTETTGGDEPKPYKGPLRNTQAKLGGEGQQEGYVQYGIDSNHEEQNQEPYRGRLR